MTDSQVPPLARIQELNDLEAKYERNAGFALKWIFKQQQWNGEKICQSIVGMSPSTWNQYTHPSYRKQRSLHAIACFCWLSQIPMTCLYLGSNLENRWPGLDRLTIQSIVHASPLSVESFKLLIVLLKEQLAEQGIPVGEKATEILNELEGYETSSFLMPSVINIDEFKEDYHQAIGRQLKMFREERGLSADNVAYILNIAKRRYMQFENATSASIPLMLGIRLRFAFNLSDTTFLTQGMKKFEAFYLARKVQQLRETLLIELLRDVNDFEKQRFADLSSQLREFSFSKGRLSGNSQVLQHA